jgi:hypothetical protein
MQDGWLYLQSAHISWPPTKARDSTRTDSTCCQPDLAQPFVAPSVVSMLRVVVGTALGPIEQVIPLTLQNSALLVNIWRYLLAEKDDQGRDDGY